MGSSLIFLVLYARKLYKYKIDNFHKQMLRQRFRDMVQTNCNFGETNPVSAGIKTKKRLFHC